MNMPIIDSMPDRAIPLLEYVQQEIIKIFNSRVISIFKFGSLGNHGDFSLCSDVDVAIMLDKVLESDHDVIAILWDRLKQSKYEYADRLSIFWSSYNIKDFTNGVGRFPALDRLDLLQHAILISGIEHRKKLPEPKHSDLIIESANFISTFMLSSEKIKELREGQRDILAKGARYFTKFVLFPVRLIFTLDFPGVIGSNKDAVSHFNKIYGESLPQDVSRIINFAYKLRNNNPNEPVSLSLIILKKGLFVLYLECLNRYYEAVLKLGDTDTAKILKKEADKISRKTYVL